ncbi:MAG: hypothetical protein K0S11_1719 [Gammaproteobacteria bacterium]|jgi:hypothetical protein|nr:hypothetical protein [Gammaproteobacteria bacterium]
MKKLSEIIQENEVEFEDVEMESIGYISSQEDSPRIIYSTGAGPCIITIAQFSLQSLEEPITVIGLTHTSGISADISEQWQVLRQVCQQQRITLAASAKDEPIASALLRFADSEVIPDTLNIVIDNQDINLNHIPGLVLTAYEQQFGLKQADMELCVLYNSLETDFKHLAISDYRLEYVTVLGGYKATVSDPGSEMRLQGYRDILANRTPSGFNQLTQNSYKSFINEQACGQIEGQGINVYAFLTADNQMEIIYERYDEQSRNQFERCYYVCDSTSAANPSLVTINQQLPNDVKEYLQDIGVGSQDLQENFVMPTRLQSAVVSSAHTAYAFFKPSENIAEKSMRESGEKYDQELLNRIGFKPK